MMSVQMLFLNNLFLVVIDAIKMGCGVMIVSL